MKKSIFKNFPRKAKKAIKRNFMKTIDPAWKPKEVKIKGLRHVRYGEVADYKNWVVCHYQLGGF